MLTIFSMPKNFRGLFDTIQTNAIRSWTMIRPACEVILLGDDEGTAEVATKFGIRHIPDVEHNEYGTPLINSIFNTAQDVASHELMCYINADIILMSDFLTAIQQIQKKQFLMIGHRWDLDLEEPWDFGNPDWEARLRARVSEQGSLHPATGTDYFVFPRGFYRDMPPFAIGRTAYDNWLIYRARSRRVPVIDATQAVFCIHQNHERTYASVGLKAAGGTEDLRKSAEAKRNLKLAGGESHIFNLQDANYFLTPSGLRRALDRVHVQQYLINSPALVPPLEPLLIPLVKVAVNLLVRVRRALRLMLKRGKAQTTA